MASSWSMVTRLCARSFIINSCSRQYATVKISRRPVRVLTKDGYVENFKKKPLPEKNKPLAVNTEVNEDDIDKNTTIEEKFSRVPPGFPPYTKMGKDDTDLSRFAMDTSCSKQRKKSGLIMLEGKRLIMEALKSNLIPKALFFSRVDDVTALPLPPTKFLFQKVNYKQLCRWSKVNTPQGVIGFFPKPSIQHSRQALPFSIICDNVRDPGNLGSILRIAASAGCLRVLLTKGSVDLWNDKVLRSAMGTHFKISIQEDVEWDHVGKLLEPDSYIVFADNKDSNFNSSADLIQDDVYDKPSMEIIEPLDLSQKRQDSDENSEFLVQTGSPKEEESDKISKLIEQLPMFPYYQIDYSQMKSIFLVIGGETEGLSHKALKFGKMHKGVRVNIPMFNNVESLNVSSALAIITHEIKRQFMIGSSQELEEPLLTGTLPAV